MSKSFRPVIEKHGPSSSSFIKPVALEEVLTEFSIAALFDGKVESTEYDEYRVLWIEFGKKFLDYIDSKPLDELISHLRALYEDVDIEATQSLLSNIKRLSHQWRELIAEDGSLRFYIDQY